MSKQDDFKNLLRKLELIGMLLEECKNQSHKMGRLPRGQYELLCYNKMILEQRIKDIP